MDAAGNEQPSAGIRNRRRQRLETGPVRPVRQGWRRDLLAGAVCAALGVACGFGASYLLVHLALWLGWDADPYRGWWRWYFIIGDRLIITATSLSAFAGWFRWSHYRADQRARVDADGNARPQSDQHADARADGNPDADSPAHSDAQRNA